MQIEELEKKIQLQASDLTALREEREAVSSTQSGVRDIMKKADKQAMVSPESGEVG